MPEPTDLTPAQAKAEAIETNSAQLAGEIVRGDAPRGLKDGAALSPVELGKVLAASGYFPDAKSAAQCAVKVLAGQELGVKPIAAMTGIYIVKDKVMVGATLLASIVQQHPDYSYRVREMSNENVQIEFFHKGEQIGVSNFSIEDARKAGTQNTDKFPRNMLFARAMSNGVKWFIPGVLGGLPVYTEGELGDEPDQRDQGPMTKSTEDEKLEKLLDSGNGFRPNLKDGDGTEIFNESKTPPAILEPETAPEAPQDPPPPSAPPAPPAAPEAAVKAKAKPKAKKDDELAEISKAAVSEAPDLEPVLAQFGVSEMLRTWFRGLGIPCLADAAHFCEALRDNYPSIHDGVLAAKQAKVKTWEEAVQFAGLTEDGGHGKRAVLPGGLAPTSNEQLLRALMVDHGLSVPAFEWLLSVNAPAPEALHYIELCAEQEIDVSDRCKYHASMSRTWAAAMKAEGLASGEAP